MLRQVSVQGLADLSMVEWEERKREVCRKLLRAIKEVEVAQERADLAGQSLRNAASTFTGWTMCLNCKHVTYGTS